MSRAALQEDPQRHPAKYNPPVVPLSRPTSSSLAQPRGSEPALLRQQGVDVGNMLLNTAEDPTPDPAGAGCGATAAPGTASASAALKPGSTARPPSRRCSARRSLTAGKSLAVAERLEDASGIITLSDINEQLV